MKFMSLPNLIQLVLFLVVVGVLVKPLGGYMQRCFNRDNTFLDPLLIPIEKAIYRLGGVDETPSPFFCSALPAHFCSMASFDSNLISRISISLSSPSQ